MPELGAVVHADPVDGAGLALGLARDVLPPPVGISGAARARWRRKYLQEFVWPAVRRAEDAAWWGPRWQGPTHEQFNSWESGTVGLAAIWEALGEAFWEAFWESAGDSEMLSE